MGGEYSFADGSAHGGAGGGSGVASPATRESLAELWQSFLEQESGASREGGAAAAAAVGKRKSRTGSLVENPAK